jgi:chromosome segregation ATPase
MMHTPTKGAPSAVDTASSLDDSLEEVEIKRPNLDESLEELETTRSSLSPSKGQEDKVIATIEKLRRELEETEDNVMSKDRKITILTHQVAELTEQLLDQKDDLEMTSTERDLLREQVKSMGATSKQEAIKELTEKLKQCELELTSYRLDSLDELSPRKSSSPSKDRDESLISVSANEWHELISNRDTSMLQAGELAMNLAESRCHADELESRFQLTTQLLKDTQAELVKSQKKVIRLEQNNSPKQSALYGFWGKITSSSSSETVDESLMSSPSAEEILFSVRRPEEITGFACQPEEFGDDMINPIG